MNKERKFDLIKGLENGFCHTWETGSSGYRNRMFKEKYKESVKSGKVIRDIQVAPRDARYRIDHYYNPSTSEKDTIQYPYIHGFFKILGILNIDETFNWKQRLILNREEYTSKDFTIGYRKAVGYYFKHKGEYNRLDFKHRPELVDYTHRLYSSQKDMVTYYESVDNLLHNMQYFITHKGLFIQ